MKKQLQITQPCREDWNDMSPKQQGRHCEACDTVVVDFKGKSREEIADYFENAEGRVCGRFSTEQLDVQPAAKWRPGVKAAAASVLAAAGLAGNAQAATAEKAMEDDFNFDGSSVENANQKQVIVRGTVRQTSAGQMVEGARINLYSGGKLVKSMMTNSDGAYVFEIQPGELANNQFSVRIFAKGQDPKILDAMTADKYEMTLNTVMEEYYDLLGYSVYEEPEVHNAAPVVRVINEEPVDQVIEEQVIVQNVIEEEVIMEMPDVIPPVIEEEEINIVIEEEVNIEEPVTTEEEAVNEELTTRNDVVTVDPESSALIFPNPTSDRVTIQLNESKDYQYNVYDLEGRLILEGAFQGSQVDLNFASEERGTYIINVYTEGDLLHSGRIVVSG